MDRMTFIWNTHLGEIPALGSRAEMALLISRRAATVETTTPLASTTTAEWKNNNSNNNNNNRDDAERQISSAKIFVMPKPL